MKPPNSRSINSADRGAVLVEAANDLRADRQPTLGLADRCRGRGQAGQGCDTGPDELVVIGDLLAIDIDLAHVFRCRMVVLKGWGRHARTQHDIGLVAEQFLPTRPQTSADPAGAQPFRWPIVMPRIR